MAPFAVSQGAIRPLQYVIVLLCDDGAAEHGGGFDSEWEVTRMNT